MKAFRSYTYSSYHAVSQIFFCMCVHVYIQTTYKLIYVYKVTYADTEKKKSNKDTVAYQQTVPYKLLSMHTLTQYTNLSKLGFDCATQK